MLHDLLSPDERVARQDRQCRDYQEHVKKIKIGRVRAKHVAPKSRYSSINCFAPD